MRGKNNNNEKLTTGLSNSFPLTAFDRSSRNEESNGSQERPLDLRSPEVGEELTLLTLHISVKCHN